jgi:hypothetical protein
MPQRASVFCNFYIRIDREALVSEQALDVGSVAFNYEYKIGILTKSSSDIPEVFRFPPCSHIKCANFAERLPSDFVS